MLGDLGSNPNSVLLVILDCARAKSVPGFGESKLAKMPNLVSLDGGESHSTMQWLHRIGRYLRTHRY